MIRLSAAERDTVFELAKGLTGCSQRFRAEIIVHNVSMRILELGHTDLTSYLEQVASDSKEHDMLVSLLTIHFTSWFREPKHYELVEASLRDQSHHARTVRILSAGCSTGQELYSLALVCKSLFAENKMGKIQHVELFGCDIDPISLQTARNGRYAIEPVLNQVPQKYHHLLTRIKTVHEEFVEFKSDPKISISLTAVDLTRKLPYETRFFDYVFCRNILIYFDEDALARCMNEFSRVLQANGTAFVGANELSALSYLPKSQGGTSKVKTLDGTISIEHRQAPKPGPVSKIRAVVVDDDPEVCATLKETLESLNCECVTFCDPREALLKIPQAHFDILFADHHMPEMTGIEMWKKLSLLNFQRPIGIVFSGAFDRTLTAAALEAGFSDVLSKPARKESLQAMLKFVRRSDPAPQKLTRQTTRDQRLEDRLKIIVIGASTGGPNALEQALQGLGKHKDCPPVVVVQHIPANFMNGFAKRLAEISNLQLADCSKEAPLKSGFLYTPSGDWHLVFANARRAAGEVLCRPSASAPVGHHRPSVDVTFESACELKNVSIFAALMTGMGKDGAQGLLKLRQGGATTYGQGPHHGGRRARAQRRNRQVH